MKRRLGFTLVEMVIVIAVIGILATVLVPTFGGIIDRANESTDVQTAGNLTTLIAMYGVENKIETETDIALAINAGKNDPEFYKNLKAKSAKQGNCFWYEYSTGTVVVGTVADIIERSKEQAEPATMGPAGDATVDGGPRSYIVPGYLLMGHNPDNKLLEALCTLESSGIENYTAGFTKLHQLVADNADNEVVKNALDAFVAKIKQTVLLTSDGLYVPAGVTTVEKVYIPFGTAALGNTTVHIVSVDESGKADVTPGSYDSFELVDSFKLQLPLGATFGANILNLQRAEETSDNPFLTGSDEIHVNAEESQLSDYFFADTTDAVIVLSNGDRYILNDTQFIKLTGEGQKIVEGETATAYGELERFGVDFTADGASDSVTYVLNDANDLYISADHTGNIILTANTFEGTLDGKAATLPIRRITVEVKDAEGTLVNRVVKSEGLIYTFAGLENGDTITVKARTITYTYTVKIVDITNFEVGSIGGVTNGTTGFGELTYSKDGTNEWLVVPSFTRQNPHNGITLNDLITVTSANGYFKFDPETNKLTLDTTKTFTGEHSDTLTIKYRDWERKVNVTLYNGDLEAFVPNSNVESMKNKGNGYVIGTQGYAYVNGVKQSYGALTLGDLFSLKAGINENDVNKVTLSISGAPNMDVNPTDWENYDIQDALYKNRQNIGEDTTLTISLSSYGSTKAAATVTVYLDLDAYNVSNADEWAACKGKDNPSIAILNSFPIDGGTTNATSGSATEDSAKDALKYAVNVGSGKVHGNLNTITVTNFYVKATYTGNYIISATAGSVIDRLLIVGPDYGADVVYDNKGSLSKGTYVTAVRVSGGTATNPVQITNSFLSGFRSPVHAAGGTLTINNSVLHLGNYANMYVDAKTTLNLTDVTTVQYEVNGNIGGGINYKHNAGTGQVIKAKNLTQYNFLSQSQVNSIVGQAGQVAADAIAEKLGWSSDSWLLETAVSLFSSVKCEDFVTLGDVTHTIGGEPYYHMGITALNVNGDVAGLTIDGDDKGKFSAQKEIVKSISSYTLGLRCWGLGGGATNYSSGCSKTLGSRCSCAVKEGYSYKLNCNHQFDCGTKATYTTTETGCTACKGVGLAPHTITGDKTAATVTAEYITDFLAKVK